jgi:biotin transport system substrate-specific component
MTVTAPTAATASTARPIALKVAAALAGALVVAAAAQIAIPIPGTPVPFTLQPLAVIIVGGLLGPRFGALSLAMYLAMGAMGLPVFTPLGAPGLARLFGPTGGYLLSYPVAAAVTGFGVRWDRGTGGQLRSPVPPYPRALLACMAGMVVIFTGGLAQLYILAGSAGVALGVTPFILVDAVKAILAALVIRRFAPSTRALG